TLYSGAAGRRAPIHTTRALNVSVPFSRDRASRRGCFAARFPQGSPDRRRSYPPAQSKETEAVKSFLIIVNPARSCCFGFAPARSGEARPPGQQTLTLRPWCGRGGQRIQRSQGNARRRAHPVARIVRMLFDT